MEKFLLVLFIGFGSSVFARSPRPTTCESNVFGPDCSEYSYTNDCKPGYTCINNRCCRDPVCPPNWTTEGQSCDTRPGEQRCLFRYECINGFCCKRPGPPPPDVCPPISMTRPRWCLFWKPGAPQCTPKDCRRGTVCCPNDCRWKMCMNLLS